MAQQFCNSTAIDTLNIDVVDLTQADLDRGLTPEQIAREKADLNWSGFRREIVRVIQDGLAKESEARA
jgi:hypothetical protein